jgi:hypothetical protein
MSKLKQLLVQFHKKAIGFQCEIKELYVQNVVVHKADETI